MVNPRTVNAGIIVPLTGADVGLWGELDVNPNMVAVDGFIAGVQQVALSNAPVTLSAPAGFAATPTPGPTQSQNRVLQFTGVLTANVTVTLPLPGAYIIDNRTTGNFVLTLRGATATEVVGIQQGAVVEVYNDGANVRFINLGRVGQLEFWAGIGPNLPAWVTACTVAPYVLADGAARTFTSAPYLANILLGQFGGNGVTTYAPPDLWGRMPLAYDNTGGRITVGGCGINGQLIGAAGGFQSITLDATMMPSHYHVAGMYDPGHIHSVTPQAGSSASVGGGGVNVGGLLSSGGVYASTLNVSAAATGTRISSSNGLDTTYSAGSNAPHNNMVPAQVAGIWVVKT